MKNAAAAASLSKGIDLDLGCLYELADGRKGVIQALGNAFGSLDAPPWILLDGDDRTGKVTGGENMSINLSQPGRFRRVLIFAMIYEGAPNWAAVDGVVTLTLANGQPVEVKLDDAGVGSRMCAVAQLVDAGGDLILQREVQLHRGRPGRPGQGLRLGHELVPRPQVAAARRTAGAGRIPSGRRVVCRKLATGRTPRREYPTALQASRTAARSLASKSPSAPPMMMPIWMTARA